MGAQKAFAVFMTELPEAFPAGWVPDQAFYKQLVAMAILYRALERVVKIEKFPAYRANIVCYSFSYLFHVAEGEIDLDAIWAGQELPATLEHVLQSLVHDADRAIRNTAGSRNVTEWCKKAECWQAVVDAMPPLSITVRAQPTTEERTSAELELPGPDTTNLEATERDIDRCLALDAAAWAKVHHWGALTRRLSYTERGVAHTLGEYAAAGWSKHPSAKQARVGARAIELAERDGILDD
jgi:hypothetical protein